MSDLPAPSRPLSNHPRPRRPVVPGRARTLVALLAALVLALAACGEEDGPGLTPGIGESPDPAVPLESPEAPSPDPGAGEGTTGAGEGTGAGEAPDTQGAQPGGQDGQTSGDAPPFMTADLPDLIEAVQPSVVAILRGAGGEGSGVIWSADGIIVSNHHVVADAGGIVVVFADGSRADATVVASDPRVDLAVLEVDAADLPEAAFRDDLPRVGELAVAIGNPLGFQGSATLGIVSGVGRSVPGSARVSPALVDLIQTDAPISPGNSGGALIGSDGRVMGINVAYIPPAGGAVSIGFAIPAPTVVDVVTQLLENGVVEHAYLGIMPATLRPGMAPGPDLGVDEGAAVLEVVAGGPAADAGIQAGDVIVRFNDTPITSAEDLFAALRGSNPGDEVTVALVREGSEQEVTVVLGDLPNG
jgi:serine protease DegQ